MRVKPFAALVPAPGLASRVASVPYDVVNTEEARALAEGNPDSFLHVIRAEIDLPGEGPVNFKDDRFSAAILLSAQGRDQQGLREGSWDGITGPMLNVTGTRDGGAKGQDWRWKVEPYEFAPPGNKYLALLTDADHYLGGIAVPEQMPVPAHKDAVQQITLAFLDAYLPGDPRAKRWLGSIADRVSDSLLVFKHK